MLENFVHQLFAEGIASSTRATYSSSQVRYLNFCNKFGINPLPLTDRSLCLFAAFLANEGLRAQSISVYLSALRHLQIAAGLQAPPLSSWPWLPYVLRGIKRSQAPSGRIRLPITSSVLMQLLQVWSAELTSGDAFQGGPLLASHFLGFAGLENFFKLPPQYLLPLCFLTYPSRRC